MKGFLIFVTITALAITALYQTLVASDARGVSGFSNAYGSFFREAATQGCVERSALVTSANTRGWRIEENPDVYAPETPTWDSALRVYVSPPLPFAKLPGVVFYFDDAGCLQPIG